MTAVVLALAAAVAACGGAAPATTTSPQRPYALEYAESARRAIEGTRFEALSHRALADLIVEACAGMETSDDPDATVLEAAGGVQAPEGEPIDDEIFAIVIAEGVAAVCPDEVQGAFQRGEAQTDPEGAFRAATSTAAFGSGVGDGGLLAAGAEVCAVLDAGGTPEEAVLAEISLIFDLEADSVAELSNEGSLSEAQGVLAGTVLGAASSLLCPEHRDLVAGYLAGLGS